MNRDLVIGATVALALHGWLLFGLTVWFRARPQPVREESFVVHLVDFPSAEIAAAPALPETALPPPPEPPPSTPPPVILPPEPELAPPAAMIATIAPAASPAPNLTPNVTRHPPVRSRAARAAGTAPTGASTSGDGTSGTAFPRYRNNPPPEYPAEARRLKQEGRVLLDVEVSAEGRPSSVSVKHSSGVASLDEAALRAVRRWSFEPARRVGLAVAARVEVPVQFALAR